MPLRSLEQWLAHQERVHPQSIDLGLERLERVLEPPRLAPADASRSSPSPAPTARARSPPTATAILAAAGYRVGTFTSPHLRDYRERIRIDNAYVEVAAGAACGLRENRRGLPAGARAGRGRHRRCRLADLFRIQRARGLADLRVGAARCLGARSRHGRAPGCGQRRRSDGRRGGEHRPRSSGVSRRDARGHRAREGGNFSRAASRRCSAARACPACSRTCARSSARRSSAWARVSTSPRARSRWRYRGTRWDLPDLPPPALAGDIQYANAATAIAALEELASSAQDHAARPSRAASAQCVSWAAFNPSAPPGLDMDTGCGPQSRCGARARAQSRRHAGSGAHARGVRHPRRQGCGRRRCRAWSDCIDEWWFATHRRGARHGRRGAGGTHGARICERPVHLAADIAAAARRRSRRRAPAIESWSSVPSTPSGRHWIGSRRERVCCPSERFANILCRRGSHEHSKVYDGSSRQRAL